VDRCYVTNQNSTGCINQMRFFVTKYHLQQLLLQVLDVEHICIEETR